MAAATAILELFSPACFVSFLTDQVVGFVCLFVFFLLTVSACGCVLTGVSCFVLGGRKHCFSRSLVRLLNRFTVCLFLSVWDEFDGDVKFWDCFCLVFGKCFPCFGDKVWDVFFFASV